MLIIRTLVAISILFIGIYEIVDISEISFIDLWLIHKIENQTLTPKQANRYIDNLFNRALQPVIESDKDLDFVLNTYLLYFLIDKTKPIDKYKLFVSNVMDNLNPYIIFPL